MWQFSHTRYSLLHLLFITLVAYCIVFTHQLTFRVSLLLPLGFISPRITVISFGNVDYHWFFPHCNSVCKSILYFIRQLSFFANVLGSSLRSRFCPVIPSCIIVYRPPKDCLFFEREQSTDCWWRIHFKLLPLNSAFELLARLQTYRGHNSRTALLEGKHSPIII